MRFFGFCVRSVAVAAMVLAAGASSAAGLSSIGSGSAALASGSYSTLLATESVNVAGISSFGELGDAGNTVINLNVGANAEITGIGWDVIVSAFDPSWLSELTVSFESSDQAAGVFLNVSADDLPGLNAAYSSGGVVDLIGLGLNFAVGADGILRIEFFEGFDDASVSPDGLWNSGTLTIQTSVVPEPGTYGLMALGLLGVVGAARRRRAE